MKVMFLGLAFISMLGCVSNNKTYISYAPDFKLEISTKDLELATVFLAEGISVRFSDGGYLSGLLITKELESLSSNFDIRDYPKYIFGLKNIAELDENQREIFLNSIENIKHTYGEREAVAYHHGNTVAYTVCANDSCLSFVVKSENKNQILMVNGVKVSRKYFSEVVKGI